MAERDPDEQFPIDGRPEDALLGLLHGGIEPMTGEDMARKHGLDGLSLRNMLRDHPELTPGHRHGEDYEITGQLEKTIVVHPAFQGVQKR